MSVWGFRSASALRAALLVASLGLALATCRDPVAQIGPDDVVGLVLSVDSAQVAVGRTLQLRAYPLDETRALLVGQPVVWSSTAPTVATVDENGLVTGAGSGIAYILASAAGAQDSARVTVAPAPSLVLSTDSVGFEVVAGGAAPASDAVTVTNGGGFALVVTVDSIVYGAGATGWLTAQLDGAVAPATLTLQATPTGVTMAGVYRATVWLTGADADGSPATVDVTLEIDAASPGSISVNAGNAQIGTVGTMVTLAPSVLVEDAFGNPVEGSNVTFAVTGGGGSVTGAVDATDAAGVARVGSWTLGQMAGTGNNTLSATVAGGGVSGNPVTFTASAMAGPATQLVIDGGDNQSALAGSAVTIPPSVAALDQFDNGVAGVAVEFVVTGGGGSLTGANPTSGPDGVAAVGTWTLGGVTGANTLRTTAAGIADTVYITATALSGQAEEMLLEAGDAQTDTVGATLAIPYAVRVVDSNGIGVPGIPVSWAVTGGGGSIGMTTPTDASGVSTAVRVLGTSAVPQTASASVGGLAGSPVVFTATATAGAPAALTVSAGAGQSATVDTEVAVDPQVTVADQHGNPIANHSVTFSVTGGGGVVSPTTSIMTLADGTATAASWKLGQMSGTNNNTLSVIAAGAGLSGNPATITASADADVPASIAIDTGNNQTAVTGTNVTFAPTVVVSDQFTNLVPGATVTFSASGSGTVGSASAATDTDGVASTTWSVNVGGHALSATGTFQNTLTATVQGTAIGTSFTGFAIYSYVTHVDPIWSTNAPGACTGCHTGAGFSGLTLSGGVAVSYPELVTEDLTCDLTLGALYRRVTTAGGISAADTYSVLMRLADPSLPAEGTCGDGGSHTTKLNATNVEIVKAWIRNGAPNN